MSTTTNQTEIVVDPDVPLVRIIREFDAPSRRSSGPTPTPSWCASGSARAATR